jgi:hypothetical protein
MCYCGRITLKIYKIVLAKLSGADNGRMFYGRTVVVDVSWGSRYRSKSTGEANELFKESKR